MVTCGGVGFRHVPFSNWPEGSAENFCHVLPLRMVPVTLFGSLAVAGAGAARQLVQLASRLGLTVFNEKVSREVWGRYVHLHPRDAKNCLIAGNLVRQAAICTTSKCSLDLWT